MQRWYQTVLNARVIFETPGIVFLSYDEEHHRIAIARSPNLDTPERAVVGLGHIAFTYADLDDLLQTYARLKSEGIDPFVSVNHGPTTSIYYRDPDGNRIELQIDNFAEMEDATQLMRETFSINPIGVDFDPDEAYRALLAGADKASLTQPRGKDAVQPPNPELIAKLRA
jgi:catechol-2,3-dioxygenase